MFIKKRVFAEVYKSVFENVSENVSENDPENAPENKQAGALRVAEEARTDANQRRGSLQTVAVGQKERGHQTADVRVDYGRRRG